MISIKMNAKEYEITLSNSIIQPELLLQCLTFKCYDILMFLGLFQVFK